MVVTIVVNTRDYEPYLGAAIDSALSQTYDEVEVVVVGGSADASRSVVEGYGDSVRPVYEETRGQAAAFNAGFAAADGDAVIFLDSHDELLPHTAELVVDCLGREPSAVMVHYRLEVVDGDGEQTGRFAPPLTLPLADGDLRSDVLRSPDALVHPPSSGNAYRSAALRRLLPLPEDGSADLTTLAALLGPVRALDAIGGRYRTRRRRVPSRDESTLDAVRHVVEKNAARRAELARLAGELGLVDGSGAPAFESVTDLAQRLVSLRLDPEAHPLPADRRAGLAASGVRSALQGPGRMLRDRALYTGWFVAMAAAPRSAARPLAGALLRSWRSSQLSR